MNNFMSLFDVKELYEHLFDAESKKIFEHRMNYFLYDNIKDLFKIVSLSENVHSGYNSENSKYYTLDEFILNHNNNKNQTLIIYGIEQTAEDVYYALTSANIHIDFFCESNINQSEFKGIKIIEPLNICKLKNPVIIMAIDDPFNLKPIKTILKCGVSPKDIITLKERELQYFGRPGLTVEKDEVFVDAGSLDGRTILSFIEWCNGNYKKIIAFEPDKNNFKKVNKTLKDNNVCHSVVYNFGLWEKDKTITFDSQGNAMSKIDESGSSKIHVKRFDNFIQEKVTFIKMDIEGAELSALKGCAETIMNFKPKLAICIYHKVEDFFEIPFYIHSLVPEYKLYLRHHSWGMHETVLYACL